MYAMDMLWADGRVGRRACGRACGRVTERTSELVGGKAGVRGNGRDEAHQRKAIRLPGKRSATLTMTARKQISPRLHRRSSTALS